MEKLDYLCCILPLKLSRVHHRTFWSYLNEPIRWSTHRSLYCCFWQIFGVHWMHIWWNHHQSIQCCSEFIEVGFVEVCFIRLLLTKSRMVLLFEPFTLIVQITYYKIAPMSMRCIEYSISASIYTHRSPRSNHPLIPARCETYSMCVYVYVWKCVFIWFECEEPKKVSKYAPV